MKDNLSKSAHHAVTTGTYKNPSTYPKKKVVAEDKFKTNPFAIKYRETLKKRTLEAKKK